MTSRSATLGNYWVDLGSDEATWMALLGRFPGMASRYQATYWVWRKEMNESWVLLKKEGQRKEF
jgi:hypothetical protein